MKQRQNPCGLGTVWAMGVLCLRIGHRHFEDWLWLWLRVILIGIVMDSDYLVFNLLI